jgi:serine/threonine protein kinase
MTSEHNEKDQIARATSAFNLTGETLGKYRLVERLGQGGMAQVYKAYQPDLDRYVAIKILHPHLTGDQDFAARFHREARAIAALEHPHIVRVYDFDTDGDLAFLVMEYLDGNSLKALLHDLRCRDEQMDFAEIGRIVGAVARALDHAHRQGLVHRDVKPSNVLIATDGRPVLTDFGIARMLDETVITESGGTLGTPAYMSPEQGKGETGDARSDIYALGVLLYQFCTGRIPFDADTPYAVILKHITAPLPSPRSLRPELPESIERVILKAMAKEPNDRYQTAGELGQALDTAIGSSQAVPRPTPRRTGLRTIALTAATAIACLALLLITRPLRIRRYLERSTLAPTSAPAPTMVSLAGPDMVHDTWLNPDLPDDVWHETDLVHLQGPLTPDRILLYFDLAGLPENTAIISATLALRVELWGEESFPGAAVVYRVLTPWEPDTATYNTPWSGPGLSGGVDYDPTPLDITSVPDEGWLVFDVNQAVKAWHERDEPNVGLVVMMAEDSHNQAHHWVYMGEQPDPADRPTLHIVYEVSQ